MRSSSSLEIKKESGSNIESERIISEMKKTMKSHMVVAALIATVTFTAGITLPGGYVQSGSNNQGKAVLSMLPTNGTDEYMAAVTRANFESFVIEDSIAMLLFMSAIIIYFIASFPIKDMRTVGTYLSLGNILTLFAMLTMVYAFLDGLQAMVSTSSFLDRISIVTYAATFFIFLKLTSFSMRILSPKYMPCPSIVILIKYIIHFVLFLGFYFLVCLYSKTGVE